MSTVTRRLGILIILFSIFVLLLVAQYFKIMVLEPRPNGSAAKPGVSVERGPILDRNGRILAVQTRLYSVTAWVPNVEDYSYTAATLADIIDIDPDRLVERLKESSGFLYIMRKISPSATEKIRKLIESHQLPGISLEPEYGRNYPEEDLASHIIGYVGTDNIGLDGIELTYDHILSPSHDESAVQDASVQYGNQLFLTIDINIQYICEEIAEQAMKEHDANSVMVLVMDAKNGEFLGWASAPDYDPNTFLVAEPRTKQNLPISYAYEPGSVFKIFSIASLLELGAVYPDSEFFCNGYYENEFPSGETVHINCLGVHGSVTPQKILQYSCNAGASYASDRVGAEEFYQQITEFGFGSTTSLPFPGESAGIFKSPGNWSGRTKPTVAIGQEISVSAVQMVTAATALTNAGMLLQPHIVRQVVSPEGKVLSENTREPLRQVLRPEVARAVLLMMESVTSETGTARRANIEGIRISAKTGTAQKVDPRTGTYSKNAFVASCMGIFPTDDPQLITYVVIDTPRGDEFYGGRIAAPMIRELGNRLITYLGIPRADENIVAHSGVVTIKDHPDIQIGATLPDLRGLSKRQLLPILSRDDINIIFKGEGWVASQEPEPGTPVTRGMQIILEFE